MKENRNIRYRFRVLRLVLCLAVICGCFGRTAYAIESGSITVDAEHESDAGVRTPIRETAFTLYQVGEESEGQWKLLPEFAEIQVPLEFSDSTVQDNSAKKLYAYIEQNGIQGTIRTTDDRGQASYEGLGRGVYLLAQTSEAVQDGKSYTSAPALIAMPTKIEESDIWKLTVIPKFEEKSIPPETSGNPGEEENKDPETDKEKPKNIKTGDRADTRFYILAALLAAGVISAAVKKKRENKS